MRDRWERILRMLSIALLALLVYRVAMVVKRRPLAGLSIPAVPTLVETNAVAAAKGTNAPAKAAANRNTNGTNSTTANAAAGTNSTKAATNGPAAVKSGTSSTNITISALPPGAKVMTNASGSNGTNGPGIHGTNAVKVAKGGSSPANIEPTVVMGDFPPGFPGGPGMPGGQAKLPELAPIIQGRLNKIIVSEIFAPLMHPQPAELMGIAGNYAFLRSSSGQMGMVKEGDSLGGLKLLEVGINRALIEEDGEKKELIIYQGLGSESLMPKTKENTNDTARKQP